MCLLCLGPQTPALPSLALFRKQGASLRMGCSNRTASADTPCPGPLPPSCAAQKHAGLYAPAWKLRGPVLDTSGRFHDVELMMVRRWVVRVAVGGGV